jgi:hypothetical protein
MDECKQVEVWLLWLLSCSTWMSLASRSIGNEKSNTSSKFFLVLFKKELIKVAIEKN